MAIAARPDSQLRKLTFFVGISSQFNVSFRHPGFPSFRKISRFLLRSESRRCCKYWCSLKRAERYTSSDWSRCLFSLPKSGILTRIRSHLFWTSLVSLIVAVIGAFVKLPHLSPLPHTLLGSAMGLLLVFRTNAAYDRFWEGRKLLGSLAVQIREMTRCITSYFDNQQYSTVRSQLIVLLKLFLLSFQHHIQGTVDIPSLRKVIRTNPSYRDSPKTIDFLAEEIAYSPNPPLFVLSNISMLINNMFQKMESLRLVERAKMEWQLSTLTEVVCGCERIINTPVPLGYSRHTSRFLSLWCFTLPLLLVPQIGFLTVPATIFVGWSLFAIEEIGHVIEDPFLEGAQKLPVKAMISSYMADVDYLSQLNNQLLVTMED
eukprot:jgi/Galph1/2632/GphlegSOOS_G1299.1